MDRFIMEDLYKKERFLNYLRMNPKWYIIMYRNPKTYKAFIQTAKESMGLTTYNQIGKIKTQIDFISGMYLYMKNG